MLTIVTNRKQIVYSDLVTHLRKCGHPSVRRIILREKDLNDHDIKRRIKKIKACKELENIPLMLNGPYPLDELYGADGRHYTMEQFRALEAFPQFPFGVSVHNLEEITELNAFNISYLLYGHIFTTACKEGLLERGLDNLGLIIKNSNNPVVSLGGIDIENYKKLYSKGSHEFAMMSSIMRSESPWSYINQFEINKLSL